MEFEALKDLIQTITRNKVKQIEVLGNPGQEDSRTEALYDGIAKGKIKSDEEAAQIFFQTSDLKDPNYRKLRNRLVRQLVNTALFVDVNQPMFNDRSKALYNCYRDFAAANILQLRGANKAAVYLMQQTLEQAIKFEFIELAVEITRFLRMRYARSVGDRANHEQFTALNRQYEEKRQLERMAQDYYEDLINYYIHKRSPNEEIHQHAIEFYDILRPLASKVDTTQFYYNTFQIGIIKYLSINDCHNAILLCDEALHLLENRKNIHRSSLFSIALQKLSCITQLHIFENEEGDKTAQYCLELVSEGEFNWFKVQEVSFYYCLYRHKYEEALQVFSEALQYKERLDVLGSNLSDAWQLYGGYLHLLAALGKLDPTKVEAAAGPFRYNKFINDFEVLDKDKEGMNIPLVLLPILFSVAKADYQEEYGRSVEALEKYRKRYLDNDMNRRSASFMVMLMAYAKKGFEPEQSEKKIKKEMAVLKSIPPQIAGQSFAVEIVPYEDLWEMLMERKK